MGAYFGKLLENVKDKTSPYINRKRKREEISEEDEEALRIHKILHTPQRKKVATTNLYIYRMLFENGENSDICLTILGKKWNLHKLYLMQSLYFESMFSGRWAEVNKDEMSIEVVDPCITVEALDVALGSLYNCDVEIQASNVVSVLAAATFLQLPGLIERCEETLVESISAHTVVDYHTAASEYGLTDVMDACMRWLLVNFTSVMLGHKNLPNIPVELMEQLVSHPDLFVVNCEMSLYIVLREWLYKRVYPESISHGKDAVSYVIKQEEGRKVAVIESPEGKCYAPVFLSLRLKDMLLHPADIDSLYKDQIIPKVLLQEASQRILKHLLLVDLQMDKGPDMLSPEEFDQTCMRFGRRLEDRTSVSWRWIGFKFGLDLHVNFDGRNIRIKWNTVRCPQLVCNQMQRPILYRLSMAPINENRQPTGIVRNPIKSITLSQDNEVSVAKLSLQLKFPMMLSFHLVLVSPLTNNTEVEDRT